LAGSHLKNTNYFNGIKQIIHKALSYPRPYRIIRIALASIFVYGGVIKRFGPKAFAAAISDYDLVMETFRPTAAVYFLCLNHLSYWSRPPAGAGVSLRGVFIDMQKSI
jgi:hypothetical protein